MEERPSRWGVGPRIAAVALAWAAIAGVATRVWPGACLITFLPRAALVVPGGLLVLFGFAMLVASARALNEAYRRRCLVDSGVFGLVRHPIYSAWIVLIVPGLALLTRSWPLLLTPIVAFIAFKRLIHREDDYLAREFGSAWVQYRNRVNELFPIPRVRRRGYDRAS